MGCLGGTFDRLHAGHKLMLSMTGLLSREGMRIGLSGDGSKLVVDKTKVNLLLPYEFRHARLPRARLGARTLCWREWKCGGTGVIGIGGEVAYSSVEYSRIINRRK